MQNRNDLRDFFELLRRRKGILLRSVLGLLLLAAMYLMLATPSFVARALVVVDQAQITLAADDPLRDALPADNSDVESEVEILRSEALALAVVERAGLLRDPDYAYAPGLSERIGAALGLVELVPETAEAALGRVLAEFRENVSVQRKGLTYVISISVEASTPARAADLANTMAEIYIDHQFQAKVAQFSVARDRLEAQIAAVTRTIEASGTALDRLYAKDELEVLSARLIDIETQISLQVPNSRIVSEALPPVEPSAPKTLVILALALVGGGIMGLGLVFAAEAYEDVITSAAQLSDTVDAPVATVVPTVPRGLFARQPIARRVVSQPLSPYSDAIRRLKATVDQSLANAPGPNASRGIVVLVTSAVPNEGKTSLSLSLARVYAQAGLNTLLIDADLRKPQVHKYARLRARHGLADYLRDPGTFEPPVMEDPKTDDLAIMVGKRHARLATDDIAGSELFASLLGAARRNFDVTVIDSPPLMPAADARYFAQQADAVLMVVRYAETGRTVVRSAAEALRDSMRPDVALFTVLNQYHASQPGYDYASYHAVRGAAPGLTPGRPKAFDT